MQIIQKSVKEWQEMYPQKKFTYMLDYLTQDQITNETKDYNIVELFRLSRTLGAINRSLQHAVYMED